MTDATPTTALDGYTYLLGEADDGSEWVSRCTDADLAETFDPAEIVALRRGEPVLRIGRDGGIRWVDMVAAARHAALA